jgi:hypothetical protein
MRAFGIDDFGQQLIANLLLDRLEQGEIMQHKRLPSHKYTWQESQS